jgi:hypothetical protein
MNVAATIYFRFSGSAQELEPFVSELSDVVVKNGFGCEGDHLASLIVLKESDIGHFVDVNDFVKSVIQNSLAIVVPQKEEADVSSGD